MFRELLASRSVGQGAGSRLGPRLIHTRLQSSINGDTCKAFYLPNLHSLLSCMYQLFTAMAPFLIIYLFPARKHFHSHGGLKQTEFVWEIGSVPFPLLGLASPFESYIFLLPIQGEDGERRTRGGPACLPALPSFLPAGPPFILLAVNAAMQIGETAAPFPFPLYIVQKMNSLLPLSLTQRECKQC